MSFETIKQKLEGVSLWLKGEYKAIQTGRATPMVLDNIAILQYGARTLISHTATVSIEDAKTLRVAPWDKSVIKDIEKAINEGDLGLSVSSDDGGLRVHFPMLTTETRVKLVKILKEKLEESRVRVRSIREEGNKEIDVLEKEGAYGEDDKNRYKEELQKLVDDANNEVHDIFSKKEKEVMGE